MRHLTLFFTLLTAFGSGAAYGDDVTLPDAERMVYAWRRTNPVIIRAWARLGHAAKHAVVNPDRRYDVARCAYHKDNGWLVCTLPSGRRVYYLEPDFTSDRRGLYFTRRRQAPAKGKHHKDESLYHGRLINHITQGTARDIMV